MKKTTNLSKKVSSAKIKRIKREVEKMKPQTTSEAKSFFAYWIEKLGL